MRSHASTRHRTRVASLATLVLLLAGCSGVGAAPGNQALPDDGPIRFGGEGPTVATAGIHADAGDQVVFGATTIRNTGDDPTTLVAGDLTGEGSVVGGADILEVRAREIAPASELVGAAYWPYEDYKDDSVALDGFRLEPGSEAELLFVVDVQKTGQWYWPQTYVRYDSAGKRYQEVLDFGFHICPRDDDVCEAPKA